MLTQPMSRTVSTAPQVIISSRRLVSSKPALRGTTCSWKYLASRGNAGSSRSAWLRAASCALAAGQVTPGCSRAVTP
jgi:hypothetical protein